MKTKLLMILLTGSLSLAGCGNNKDDDETVTEDTSNISIPALDAGVYAISVGSEDEPTIGKYYVAANGEKLLILNQVDEHAEKVYFTDANKNWQSLPKSESAEQLTFLNQEGITNSKTLEKSAFNGHYLLSLNEQDAVVFNIDAQGKVTTSSTETCNLSGQLDNSQLPNSLKISLTTKNCTSLPNNIAGYLVVDEDYSPAVFRLINTDTALKDLWIFEE